MSTQNEVFYPQRLTHRQTTRESIEGERYLTYRVVIPPDAPKEHEHNGHDNETQDEDNRPTNKAQPAPVPDDLQSSSVDQYPWGEGRFEPAWGR